MRGEWADKFYHSKAWKVCREAYIKTVHYQCEKCGNAGYIVHHKIEINSKNCNDVNVTLNHSNLELLCLPCHNSIHYGEGTWHCGSMQFDEHGEPIMQ